MNIVCMLTAPMFSVPKLISIIFMKRKLIQEDSSLHNVCILLRSVTCTDFFICYVINKTDEQFHGVS
jgi:hypothetical protein